MTTEDPGSPTLPRLLSVPGLLSVAVFGILVIVMSRLFGPQNLLREVVTELLASFGSTILLLAVFGLFFRSGLQRLLRGAPGGETFAQSAERLSELLRDLDQKEENEDSRDTEGQLDRIERGIKAKAADEIPALRNEIRELREALERDHGEEDQARG
jgi:HAMP domain-containing protein